MIANLTTTLQASFSKGTRIYLITAFTFSWLVWLPLIINEQGLWHIPILQMQHFLASFGPLAGAFAASIAVDGWKDTRNWLRRVFSLRFSFKWVLIAIGLPVFYGIIGVLVQFIITGKIPDWSSFGLTEKLPGLNIIQTGIVWMATYGLGEETGWRGYLLPELKKNNSLLKSSLIVAVIWILWHMPAFLFNPNYMDMGFGIIGWMIGLAYGSVLLSWLCRGSGWSVIPVILWHGVFDLLTAGDNAGIIAPACSMLVIVHGILLSRHMAKNEAK